MLTASRAAIEAALHDHVRSAAMPCPYARATTRYLHLDEVAGAAARTALSGALRELAAAPGAPILCVVPREQPDTPRDARAQVYQLRCQLHLLDLESAGALSGEVAGHLQARYAAWSDDAESFLGPRMRVAGADVMTTAFNPCYPAGHPRRAPYACLVVIRTADLKAVHDERPGVARAVAVHSKCLLLRSLLADASGIGVDEMRGEFPRWVRALDFYRPFVTTDYTAGRRMDPRTLPRLLEVRRRCAEAMESDRFRASLVAFRARVESDSGLPTLARILRQNPRTTVFDVAAVVYGDVAGMYVPHS